MTCSHLGFMQITRVAQSCCLHNQAEVVREPDMSSYQQKR